MIKRPLIGQANIIFSHRRTGRIAVHQIVQFRFLDFARNLYRESVHHGVNHQENRKLSRRGAMPDRNRHLPRRMNSRHRSPGKLQRDNGRRWCQVQALGPGWWNDMPGITTQEQAPEGHGSATKLRRGAIDFQSRAGGNSISASAGGACAAHPKRHHHSTRLILHQRRTGCSISCASLTAWSIEQNHAGGWHRSAVITGWHICQYSP